MLLHPLWLILHSSEEKENTRGEDKVLVSTHIRRVLGLIPQEMRHNRIIINLVPDKERENSFSHSFGKRFAMDKYFMARKY